MKNVYTVGFLVLFLLAGAISAGRLLEHSANATRPPWLIALGVSAGIAWLILLVVVSVLYVRKANELRNSYWSVERRPVSLANPYRRQVIFAFGLAALSSVLGGLAGIYPEEILGVFLPILTLFMVIAFLFASIILYIQEDARVGEAAYFDLAQQLGVDDKTLADLRNHPHDFQSPRYGLWAEAVVTYRGHPILFGCGQIVNLPCFVLIMETQTNTEYSGDELTQGMTEETRQRFENIRRQVKKVDLSCDEGTVLFTIPLISRTISVELLRGAMDVLIDVAGGLVEKSGDTASDAAAK
jgi:hypothetical protein